MGDVVARETVNLIGTIWRRSADSWKWGTTFVCAANGAKAVAEICWSNSEAGSYGGELRVALYGEHGQQFLGPILKAIYALSVFPCNASFKEIVEDSQSATNTQMLLDRASVAECMSLEEIGPDANTALGRRLLFSVELEEGSDETKFPRLLRQALEGRSNGAYHLFPVNTAESARRLSPFIEFAKGDQALLFLSKPYLFSELRMTQLVLLWKHVSAAGGRKGNVRVWRLPSSGDSLDRSATPSGSSDGFDAYWKKQLDAYHQSVASKIGAVELKPALIATRYFEVAPSIPCWQLYHFMVAEKDWQASLARVAESSIPVGSSGDSVDEPYVRTVADEFHDLMCKPLPRSEGGENFDGGHLPPTGLHNPAIPSVVTVEDSEILAMFECIDEDCQERLQVFWCVGLIERFASNQHPGNIIATGGRQLAQRFDRRKFTGQRGRLPFSESGFRPTLARLETFFETRLRCRVNASSDSEGCGAFKVDRNGGKRAAKSWTPRAREAWCYVDRYFTLRPDLRPRFELPPSREEKP